MTFVKYYCKYDKCNTLVTQEHTFKQATLKEALSVMKQWPAKMYAYNKLRALDSGNDFAKKKYLAKYDDAFKTCIFSGVPHMTTSIVGVTNQVYWIVTGEILLLIASTLLFAWGTCVNRHLIHVFTTASGSSQGKNNQYFVIFEAFVTLVNIVVPLVAMFFALGHLSAGQPGEVEDGNAIDHLQNVFVLTGVIVIWWILFAVMCVLAGFSIIKKLVMHFFESWKVSSSTSTTTEDQIYFAVNNEGAWQTPGMLAVETEGEQGATATRKSPILENMYTAQISLDLPIIIGLTVTAVGITLQRGAADYSVIVAVIVLFTTIGLVTHISNVLRMMHLQAQGIASAKEDNPEPSNTAHNTNMRGLVYNRVLIVLLIAAMIFLFFYLAGLDSQRDINSETPGPGRITSKHLFGSQQQFIFAIFGFVVLTFGDLSLEFTGLVYRSTYYDTAHYFYKSLVQKYKHTAWIIVLGIIVLNYHATTILCELQKNTYNQETSNLYFTEYCTRFGLWEV